MNSRLKLTLAIAVVGCGAYVRPAKAQDPLDVEQLMLRTLNELEPSAVPDLIKKGEKGDHVAQTVLAWAYMAGHSVPKDIIQSEKWSRRAAESGVGVAQCLLGSVFTSGEKKDYAEAMRWFRKAAATDQNTCGELNIGMMYLEGEGVPVNINEALKWLRQAAGRPSIWGQPARMRLGEMFWRGEQVSRDFDEAIRWYSMAVHDRNPEAAESIAMIRIDQELRKTNPPESGARTVESAQDFDAVLGRVKAGDIPDLTRKAEAGETSAEVLLGWIYLTGKTVPSDLERASSWMLKAAEAGSPIAECGMGAIYLTSNKFAQSLEWFRRAAIREDACGQWSIGHFYFAGKGVPKDTAEALRWFRFAAKHQGSYAQAAQSSLAESYWKEGQPDSTPGLSVKLQEVSRKKGYEGFSLGKTLVTYQLSTLGFPKGEDFSFWFWPLGEEPVRQKIGFVVDDAGHLICGVESSLQGRPAPDGSQWCDEPLDGMKLSTTAAPGEGKRLAVVSRDWKFRAFVKVIPFPIEAKDGRCRLSTELSDTVGVAYDIRGEGFQPNENVEFTSRSEGEQLKGVLKADAEGTISMTMWPQVLGKDSGLASWTARGKSCKPTLNYKWGKAAFEWQ